MSTDAGLSPLRLQIEPGVLAVFNQRLVVICSPIRNGRVEVQDLASQEQRDIAIGELRGRPTMAMAEFGRRMESQDHTDEADWARAVDGAKNMATIVASAGMRRDDIDAAAKALGVSTRTVYRWLARYLEAKQPSSLLPRPRGPPTGSKYLNEPRELIIRQALEDQFLKQPRITVAQLVRELSMRCHAAGLPPVSRHAVTGRIAALDARLVMRKRYGAKQARAQLAPCRAIISSQGHCRWCRLTTRRLMFRSWTRRRDSASVVRG